MSDDLARIEEALSYISADCDRETWLRMALIIKSAVPGDKGFQIFNKWSGTATKKGKYDKDDAKTTWQFAQPYRVKIGSLFYEAKQHGWRPGDGRAYIQPQPEPEPDTKAAEEAARKHKAALWTFDGARSIRGTIAEVYLKARGLELAGDFDHVLRFLPSCLFGDEWHPALVAQFTDILTNERGGIHRTALRRDGSDRVRARRDGTEWDGKMMLGPKRQHAIKFTPDEDVSIMLGVGEGIESSLSLRLLPEFGDSPVWAAGNDGGLKKLPVLAGVETLWVAVDQDEAGHKASAAVADRWTAAGCEVFLVNPREGNDVNDMIRRWRNG